MGRSACGPEAINGAGAAPPVIADALAQPASASPTRTVRARRGMLLPDFHQRQDALELALHDGVLVAADAARLLRDLLLDVLVQLLRADDAVAVEVAVTGTTLRPSWSLSGRFSGISVPLVKTRNPRSSLSAFTRCRASGAYQAFHERWTVPPPRIGDATSKAILKASEGPLELRRRVEQPDAVAELGAGGEKVARQHDLAPWSRGKDVLVVLDPDELVGRPPRREGREQGHQGRQASEAHGRPIR